MKKIFTIGGAVLGTILAAALVIFIFFPGLPTYIIVKHKYDHIDELVPEFERSDIPADYVSHTLKGITFRTPSDWEGHSAVEGAEASSYKSGDEYRIFVLKTDHKQNAEDTANYAALLGDDYEYSYDPWESYKFTEADYRHFYKSIGTELPQYGLAYRLIWYTRNGFTAKDCLKLRGKDKEAFLELADNKEKAVDMEKMWQLKNSKYSAYVAQVLYGSYDGNIWDVTIFPNNNEDIDLLVTLKCPDETTARQIISSIELE